MSESELKSAIDATRRNLLIGTVGFAAGVTLPAIAAVPATATKPSTDQGRRHKGTITTKDGTSIYFKDWGAGRPIVFSHGWPLSADAWEDQMVFLAERGYRCIAHDRRGHGRSRVSRGTATTWTPMQTTLRRSSRC